MKVSTEHMDFSPGPEESLAVRVKVEEILEKIPENNILYFIQPRGNTSLNFIYEVTYLRITCFLQTFVKFQRHTILVSSKVRNTQN